MIFPRPFPEIRQRDPERKTYAAMAVLKTSRSAIPLAVGPETWRLHRPSPGKDPCSNGFGIKHQQIGQQRDDIRRPCSEPARYLRVRFAPLMDAPLIGLPSIVARWFKFDNSRDIAVDGTPVWHLDELDSQSGTGHPTIEFNLRQCFVPSPVKQKIRASPVHYAARSFDEMWRQQYWRPDSAPQSTSRRPGRLHPRGHRQRIPRQGIALPSGPGRHRKSNSSN